MLASSVAPVRSDATLASTIDPMAAQKALRNAVSGLDATGWMSSAAIANSPVAKPEATNITPTPPTVEPVMTEELMTRLIIYIRKVKTTSSINAKLCKIFDLCDGTANMPYMNALSDSTDGKHYIGMRPEADSTDVVILVVRGSVMEAYLTDKTGKLRAAAIVDGAGTRLITNEKAAAKYKAEMTMFAGEAASLPPTGTAVAGNS